MDASGWSDFEAGLPFGLAIFAGNICGHNRECRGASGLRFSGILPALMWTASLLGAAFAPSNFIADNTLRLWLLLSFSAIGGFGLGTGYITPVSTLLKWFPDGRSYANGLAIMGFGFGAFLGERVMSRLIGTEGISSTFCLLGRHLLTDKLISAHYLTPPPIDWA